MISGGVLRVLAICVSLAALPSAGSAYLTRANATVAIDDAFDAVNNYLDQWLNVSIDGHVLRRVRRQKLDATKSGQGRPYTVKAVFVNDYQIYQDVGGTVWQVYDWNMDILHHLQAYMAGLDVWIQLQHVDVLTEKADKMNEKQRGIKKRLKVFEGIAPTKYGPAHKAHATILFTGQLSHIISHSAEQLQ